MLQTHPEFPCFSPRIRHFPKNFGSFIVERYLEVKICVLGVPEATMYPSADELGNTRVHTKPGIFMSVIASISSHLYLSVVCQFSEMKKLFLLCEKKKPLKKRKKA